MADKIIELTMRLSLKGLSFSKREYTIVKESPATYSCHESAYPATFLKRISKKDMNVVEATRMFFPSLTFRAWCLGADEVKYSRELVAMVEKDTQVAINMFKKCDEDLKKLLKGGRGREEGISKKSKFEEQEERK